MGESGIIRIYIRIYVQVYIAIVPCFHSFAERSKELCRRGIKSLNDASMKEGSIGTRNCTVNTEKNVVTGRRGPRREKKLKRKGKDSENGKGGKKKEEEEKKKRRVAEEESIADRKPSRERPIKVSA